MNFVWHVSRRRCNRFLRGHVAETIQRSVRTHQTERRRAADIRMQNWSSQRDGRPEGHRNGLQEVC